MQPVGLECVVRSPEHDADIVCVILGRIEISVISNGDGHVHCAVGDWVIAILLIHSFLIFISFPKSMHKYSIILFSAFREYRLNFNSYLVQIVFASLDELVERIWFEDIEICSRCFWKKTIIKQARKVNNTITNAWTHMLFFRIHRTNSERNVFKRKVWRSIIFNIALLSERDMGGGFHIQRSKIYYI